jgi:hypothetical protein
MSLLWHCSDNYNTIRLYLSCDVVLTIIIQFVFVSLVTLFWQLQHNSFLSLSWRCYDNYNTILFKTSREWQTELYYNCQKNITKVTKTNCIIIVRTTSQEWQRELYYNCHNNVTRVIKTNCVVIVRTTSQEKQKRIVL